ncbi:hypothetical protein VB005_02590 [Metarhizium brunneum]
MSYFTFNLSASTQGPPNAKKEQCTSSSSELVVPQLDHESSTLPTNSPATTLCEPALCGQPTLNPGAPWIGFDGSLLVDGPINGGALPSYDQSSFHPGLTTNDDLRWMLMGMNDRIATLEQAAATANQTVDQLAKNVCDMLSRLAVIEGMLKVVEDLKQNLRDFTRGLMPHILRVNLEEDLERHGQCASP